MKICSLLPSGTEILFALGLGEHVVGVSDLCDYPPETLGKRVVSRSKLDPTVLSSDQVEDLMQRMLAGGEDPYELDIEWLVQESPDLVLTQDVCGICELDADHVQGAIGGMAAPPQVMVLQPRTLQGIFDTVFQIGDACGAPDSAARLVDELRGRVAAISQKLSQVTRRPRVFSLEGVNPIVTGGHWVPELLQLAGGRQEMFAPGAPAARPQWKEICHWAPEKLFIDLCSSDLARNLREVPWLAEQEGWASLPAVNLGEVYLLDHAYFSRPGPRIVQGLEILAQLTHPELLLGLIPPNTVLKLDPDLATECPPSQLSDCFKPYPLL